MTDSQWDKLLKIRTTGRDDSHSDQYRFPYEPTPYSVLERLAGSGYLGKKNTLLDYGCGKGRVSFYLAYQAGCRCIGIEADDRIYAAGLENLENPDRFAHPDKTIGQKLKKIRDMRKIVIIGMVAVAATACNVTRTITTRSEAWQKGDTSVVIQTKTVETYDASKKGL